MTRIRVYQAGGLLCGVLCVWNYILILKEDTLYQTLTPWVIHPPWLIYGIRLACVTAVGILLTAALRSGGRKKHTCFSIFTALMVVIYAVIMEAMTYNLSYQMQSLSVSLWPFATYGAAYQTRQWIKNTREKRPARRVRLFSGNSDVGLVSGNQDGPVGSFRKGSFGDPVSAGHGGCILENDRN